MVISTIPVMHDSDSNRNRFRNDSIREFPHLKTHVKHVTHVYCLTTVAWITKEYKNKKSNSPNQSSMKNNESFLTPGVPCSRVKLLFFSGYVLNNPHQKEWLVVIPLECILFRSIRARIACVFSQKVSRNSSQGQSTILFSVRISFLSVQGEFPNLLSHGQKFSH